MNTTRWIIGLTGILAMGAAAAQCPTDEAQRFVNFELVEVDEKILFEKLMKVRIDDHQFDSVHVGVNEDTKKVFQKAALQDLPGTGMGLDLRIGPRKSAADVIIGESERSLWVKTMLGNVCKSERRIKLFGGDSRVTAIVIGIKDYENVRDLKYAEQDAAGFEQLLLSAIPESELNPVPLLGTDAKLAEITLAIYKAAGNASAFGTVLVYFSGHGTLVKDTTTDLIDAYYVPQDGADALPPTLLAHKWVVDKLSSSKAANKILISDSCFSGTSLTRTVNAAPNDFGTSKSLFGNTAPTLITEALSKQAHWFVTSPALLWFSSSTGTEVSYETEKVTGGGGLFTHYLLASLERGGGSYSQARKFVEESIAGAHQGVQSPGLSGDARLQDMHFPLTVRGNAP